jgi:hypothetical protein
VPTYEIIVTDVTCYGTLYCVAGWDSQAGGMVRPEPVGASPAIEASRFWNSGFAGPGKLFSVGNKVRFEAALPPPNFPFPHATEDRILITAPPAGNVGQMSLAETAQAVAAGVSTSLSAAFGGALVRTASSKAYVPAGHNGCSLGAIEIASTQMTFYEDNSSSKSKLRAVIRDGNIGYNLSVPADAARTRWKAGGLAALRADLEAAGSVHVRVGLARPFSAMPSQCFAQVNGIYFL